MYRKIYLAASVSVLAFCGFNSAQAQSITQELEALKARIAELEAQQAVTQNDVIQVKKKTETPKSYGSATGKKEKGKGFKVGDTTLKFGGIIDLDVHFTETSDADTDTQGGVVSQIQGDQFFPAGIPVAFDEGLESGGDFQFDSTVNSSRLWFGSTTPTKSGKDVNTHVEVDFLVSGQGNETLTNGFAPRIRRVYVDYNGWRVGQEWSTFQGLHAIPESASFYAPAESQVFIRQPQIRYTKGNFQFALEQPETTVNTLNAPAVTLDGNNEPTVTLTGVDTVAFQGAAQNEGFIPDFVARYNLKGDWGIISASALLRQLQFESGDVESSTFGYGLSIAGRVKTFGDDDVRFTLNGGQGIGRYISLGLTPDAQFNPATGEFDAVGAFSGNIAYRKVIGPWSANLGISYLNIDLPSDISTDPLLNFAGNLDETSEAYSGHFAVLRKVAPGMTLGVEYLRGVRENFSEDRGSLNRFTFSAKKVF